MYKLMDRIAAISGLPGVFNGDLFVCAYQSGLNHYAIALITASRMTIASSILETLVDYKIYKLNNTQFDDKSCGRELLIQHTQLDSHEVNFLASSGVTFQS